MKRTKPSKKQRNQEVLPDPLSIRCNVSYRDGHIKPQRADLVSEVAMSFVRREFELKSKSFRFHKSFNKLETVFDFQSEIDLQVTLEFVANDVEGHGEKAKNVIESIRNSLREGYLRTSSLRGIWIQIHYHVGRRKFQAEGICTGDGINHLLKP